MKLDLARHNRKDKVPSQSMSAGTGTPLFCPWIENSMTILSDGTVTCGLDDSDGLRSFGNIHDEPLEKIFANPEYTNLRDGLRAGKTCRDCALYQPLVAPRPTRNVLPNTLVVEPTVRCNLRCPQMACFANNSADHKTRDTEDLPRDVLDRALRQLGSKLVEVYFFNYGDPFMHRDAPDMIADMRRHSPDVKIVTSTNGIPLSSKRKAQQVVDAGLDHIVFTISGMTQESYARYHVNGRLESALRGMRNVAEARRTVGAKRPIISWRYLGFRWTDSFAELDEAIALSKELGVDDFNIYLTHIPEDGWSYRLAEGTYGHAIYRPWINVAYGYNRPPPPDNGLFPTEELPDFGTARWTNWHGKIRTDVRDGAATLWLSTNSPSAAERGYSEVFVRGAWGRLYKVRAPYCAWGKIELTVPGSAQEADYVMLDVLCPDPWYPADWLGVEDFRCLGVLTTTAIPDGTLPQQLAWCRPATPFDCHRFARRTPDQGLVPVASAQFYHKKV
jgi:MoaA/NifB/PqqE/SkfB family radical SAM enzyme